ncbi:MAG: EscU/YscU/HrcU family type III secretion system export apparatus switch protein [Rhodobacteraceae bacterium]|nr:EscU/YscU/HrcU family type III secretion system export apparatus switch protein [Paracoccaceae bacterium]
MPTTARLVAALFFAALGWFTADLIKPLLPEGTAVGKFSQISAGFGLLVGWFFTGKRLGASQSGALGMGLASSFLLSFWVLLAFSGYKMVRLSMRSYYDGPVDALQNMFAIAVDYLWLAAVAPVIGALVIGGLIGGWLTGSAAKHWS